MLKTIDKVRLNTSNKLNVGEKSRLGQFMTPAIVARFMASLFTQSRFNHCSLLDAGAGIGSLSTAFLERTTTANHKLNRIEIKAYEVDKNLREQLENVFACYEILHPNQNIAVRILEDDFIESAVNLILSNKKGLFTHTILNPPYKKISSDSYHRQMLRQVGVEAVNLYSAFVALALELLEEDGQLVAIIPRSFCNGTYYQHFRRLILQKSSIRQIHLFDARNKAFRDDNVLQENVIIHLEKSKIQGDVIVSTSTDDSFSDLASHSYSFDRIVREDDNERFIHIPTSTEFCLLESSSTFNKSLSDLFIEVSTGPVVDFRVKEHIRQMPEPGTVPLLYPGHFVDNSIEFPKINWKKPNAISFNRSTEKWLYPKGFYAVVRRFSAKEQKRRIHASVVNPDFSPESIAFGFENHLNVFHFGKKGIPEDAAYGLAAYLNSTPVDQYFRRFNGHTQVNAADLRKLKYPDLTVLKNLGVWAKEPGNPSQEMIDEKLIALI